MARRPTGSEDSRAAPSAGPRTRRYHGWYVPAIPPPRRRWMMVSGCDEFVTGRGADDGHLDAGLPRRDAAGRRAEPRRASASSPSRPGCTRPASFAIERSLCLVRERSLTIVRYVNRGTAEAHAPGPPAARLPRIAPPPERNGATGTPRPRSAARRRWVRPLPYLPRLFLRGVFGDDAPRPVWYRHFRYAEEAARGYDAERRPLEPARMGVDAAPRRAGVRRSSPSTRSPRDPDHLPRRGAAAPRRSSRRRRIPSSTSSRSRAEVFVAADHRAADHPRGLPVAGGLGAPGDGRRARSRPGARAASGSLAQVLNTFAAPAPRRADPEPLLGRGGRAGVRLRSTRRSGSSWRWSGSGGCGATPAGPRRCSARCARSSTRTGGERASDRRRRRTACSSGDAPGRALTWMDAVVDGAARHAARPGRAVEVNALWHAALKSAARLERLAGETGRARELESEAWHVGRRFNETFWCGEKGYLYDVVGDGGPDASLRPNQILAVSLTEDLLPPHRARSVYWTVRRELLTPVRPAHARPGRPALPRPMRRRRARAPRGRASGHRLALADGPLRRRALPRFRPHGRVAPHDARAPRAASGPRPRGGPGLDLRDVRRRSAPHAPRLLRAGVERGGDREGRVHAPARRGMRRARDVRSVEGSEEGNFQRFNAFDTSTLHDASSCSAGSSRPTSAAGLGVACEGLVRGLLELDTEVMLVLPEAREPSTPALRSLQAGGRAPPPPKRRRRRGARGRGIRLKLRRVRTLLRPYLTDEAYAEEIEEIDSSTRAAPDEPERPVDLRTGPPRRGPPLRRAGRARIAARETLRRHPRPRLADVPGRAEARAGQRASRWSSTSTRPSSTARAPASNGFVTAHRAAGARRGRPRRRGVRLHGRRARDASTACRASASASSTTRSTPSAAGRALQIGEEDPLVLFAGRITWQKGPEYFVEAAARVAAELPRRQVRRRGFGRPRWRP